jgi:uncharacterized protein DUF2794
MLVSMSDDPIVFTRADAPHSARSFPWGSFPPPRAGEVAAQRPEGAGIKFDRLELKRILNVYGRMVMAGEWRDYAIDFRGDVAVFSIFRRASEMPLYAVEKRPKLKDRQGQYSVVAAGGQVLKRGHDLSAVLSVLEVKLLKLVSE